jgi:glycosyltransferase involved in cell wall biosynthesis
LFYAEFNIRLFLLLLFSKSDVLLANDLDTLPANFLAAKLKNKKLVYDSHEYFTEVPELIKRPRTKRIWEWIERKTVPAVDDAYTVCDSIAEIYTKKYSINFKVVRNVPIPEEIKPKVKARSHKIILYQGALNTGRGLQQAILAMQFIKDAKLLLVGDGDIARELKTLVSEKNLNAKVEFAGRMSIEDLKKITPQADVGLSIEEDRGLNYRYTLPNKLFDYAHAGVPVVVSNLPEMAAIVKKYQIGEICRKLNPEELASTIIEVLRNGEKRKFWKANLVHAATELNWVNEEIIVKKIYSPFL